MTETQPVATPTPAARPPKSFHQNNPLQIVALLSWVVAWMVAQSLLNSKGLNAKQQVTAFVAIIIAIYGAAFLTKRAWFYQLLTSVNFAVSQVLFMALSVLMGTVVLQELASADYERLYGHTARKLIALTHSADLYRSLWFYALLSLLALSMLAVAWKRRPYPPHRIGFLLVHISTSLILLGGLWGKYSYVRAFNELRAGEPADTFYKVKGGRILEDPVPLPGFHIRLNQFTAEHYDPE